jgi:tRNA(Arg) A34 adenosine deaminase TadA
MQHALVQAEKAYEAGEVPIGAVVVSENRIIGRGYNQREGLNDPTAHGEVVAIRQACKTLNNFNLSGCELYSTCEPCPMCLSAIYWARIDKIYYANTRDDAQKIDFDDSFIYSEFKKNINKRKIPMIQIMRNEALKAFELWDKKTDKVKY